MSGMLLKNNLPPSPSESRHDNREVPHALNQSPICLHRGSNASSLLGILLCLPWQKSWLRVQTELESQSINIHDGAVAIHQQELDGKTALLLSVRWAPGQYCLGS